MRKILMIVGIVIVLVVVAVGVFVATFNPNDYRGVVQAKLEQQLDRKVSLGNMELGLFPLRFKVGNPSVAEDPKFNSKIPFIQAHELNVSVKLLPLLSKSVEIDSLSLERPSVELIKDAQGGWNFASIAQNTPETTTPTTTAPRATKPAAPAAPAATPSSSSNDQRIILSELLIKDGQVAITDLQAHKPRMVYDHINVRLTDFSLRAPFNLDASVHLPGAGNQEVHLQGKGGPISHTDPANTPFKGTLDLKGVVISGLQKFLQSPALVNTDGILSGHTNISSSNGTVAASGQMNLEKPRLHGIDVGYPINMDYDISDDLNESALKVNKGAIKLGPTPLSITGVINSKNEPTQVYLNLKASDVSIAEIARLAAAAGMAFSPNTTVNGRISADIQARGAAERAMLNGTLTGRDIQISGKDIAKPVQVKALKINLTPSEVRSDPFDVTSGGTTATAQFSVKLYTTNTPVVDATLRAPQAALADLLSMAKAYGVTSLDKISGAGNLSLDMHAAGPVQALTSDQMVKALNGTINLNFNNVRYAGVDISHQLTSLLGSGQSAKKDQGFTNILKMTGAILVKNGLAQTNNLQALLDIGNVGAVGTANLVSQTLNMQVNAVLSKAFSQQIGSAGAGSYVNAALANSQGELVIPATVTGTFQNPKFAPDLQKMAQMKLKGLMPTADNPLGGAASILGLTGQKGQPAGKGQPQQQADPVNQIMGLFGNKKKK